MRAIQHQQVINCQYVSLSSGASHREIIPHAIVNNGHRWHIRAFDRKSNSFRDFVCTRFITVTEKNEPTQNHELAAADIAWTTILPIVLKPHPKLSHSLAIELDYSMTNGEITLDIRAALAGYLLQQWQVDCSINYQLNEKQYPLALANVGVLANCDNALLAPGFITTFKQEA